MERVTSWLCTNDALTGEHIYMYKEDLLNGFREPKVYH